MKKHGNANSGYVSSFSHVFSLFARFYTVSICAFIIRKLNVL